MVAPLIIASCLSGGYVGHGRPHLPSRQEARSAIGRVTSGQWQRQILVGTRYVDRHEVDRYLIARQHHARGRQQDRIFGRARAVPDNQQFVEDALILFRAATRFIAHWWIRWPVPELQFN